ncbi:hypothetical protein FQZ97_1145770 [compost metagenome]
MLVAQQGHHLLQAELVVEVGPANVHTGGGQHVTRAVSQLHALRAQPHHGEIGRATPQVHHQHHALALQPPLVVQRGGNRLQLKRHLPETHGLRGLQQGVLRQRVALQVIVDKMHRPAHDHLGGRHAQ